MNRTVGVPARRMHVLVACAALASAMLPACDEELGVMPRDTARDTGGSSGGSGADAGGTGSGTANGGPALPPTPGLPDGAIIGETKTLDVFGGTTTSFATTDSSGRIDKVGLTLAVSIVSAIPTTLNTDVYNAVDVPAQAKAETAISLVSLDFTPHGHPPLGKWDIPHFDFHSYLDISKDELKRVDCLGANDADLPASNLLPAGWMAFPPCIPQMGGHGVTANFMEITGVRQTTDCLLTFYKGRVLSYEPKMTVDALLARKDAELPTPILPKFNRATRVPTKVVWKYTQKDDIWTIYYTDFIDVAAL